LNSGLLELLNFRESTSEREDMELEEGAEI
jgi:hypothetical protein